ncbi:MAG TPA: acylphosphatase [Cyclobacteriaceae bacterium]|nr:acylphosphatase [Cyclobacteriaceae bacterium]HMV07363.1 acylphosphatase [Cyclobacteriaceae bacterium]HMV88841.1 acylphosphatase [Cyclobacteriaceae bacterium]HMW99282.1 acylphosphatase [Cyclobacteriaceae bacterium]HMX48929.1 acylphosphatase [Cyclobacteriaceae bacterium]
MKAVKIRVTGRVQGVFYRASAKDAAVQLMLKGFAQNQPDGSVYIEVEGDEENLNSFIAWCKHGPPRASVSNVVVEETGIKKFQRFEIRR